MNIITDPIEIERKSMEIIDGLIGTQHGRNEKERSVIKRVVHTTGDPQVADSMFFHEDAVAAGYAALHGGARIITDVTMVMAGINKKRLAEYGGHVECLIHTPEVVEEAKHLGVTRAMVALRHQQNILDGAVVAIGNAPTALFELLSLIKHGAAKPALIVGVPVGFVGAAESKELLIAENPLPFITLRGNKGGSNVAASIINALMYMKA